MNGKINYQRQLDDIIAGMEKDNTAAPKVLLHSCCAPCSSYCMEYLAEHFELGVLYFNPNISEEEEYNKRIAELKRLVGEMHFRHEVKVIEGRYDPQEYFDAVKGLEAEPEGGERCFVCFRLRLREAAEYAKRLGYDYFTTTLTISPLKNAAKINEIGNSIAEEFGVKFLPSDFKKKNGYKRSIELSNEHHLYRQNYCGCIFSKRD